MSYEVDLYNIEKEKPTTHEIIYKSQFWLDLRRVLALVGIIIILLILRYFLGITIPLWLVGSVLIGLSAGVAGGYRLYRPRELIELDVREFPDVVGITLYPRHRRKLPEDAQGIVKTVSRGGMDVVVLTNIKIDDTTELKATVQGYQKLAKRYEQALHRLRVLERELELKAMEKARAVLKDYLEARKKLLEEWKEVESNERGEGSSRSD